MTIGIGRCSTNLEFEPISGDALCGSAAGRLVNAEIPNRLGGLSLEAARFRAFGGGGGGKA